MEIGGVSINSQGPQTTSASGDPARAALSVATFKKTQDIQQQAAEQLISSLAETAVVKDPNSVVGQNLDVFA
ncbi:MAG: putative motility protein [Candidatus Sedimenticola sp. (ex Thyasira tokunagai)]